MEKSYPLVIGIECLPKGEIAHMILLQTIMNSVHHPLTYLH